MGLSVEDESTVQQAQAVVSPLQRRISLVRNVFAALAAFKEVAPRGHVMYSLRAEGCDLRYKYHNISG